MPGQKRIATAAGWARLDSEALIRRVERDLRRAYGAVPKGLAVLGNKANPLDELVYIQLSVRTREETYTESYRQLRRLVDGKWGRLLDVSDARALGALGAGGMARVKLARLRAQFAHLQDAFGRVTLSPLGGMDDGQAETFLMRLPGVGPKVARCVLLYSLDRDVFPVDSNCLRVMKRLRLVPPTLDRRRAHDFAQGVVPKGLRRSLHVNLVRHGRQVCVVGSPRCNQCVLLDVCPTGGKACRGVLRLPASPRRAVGARST